MCSLCFCPEHLVETARAISIWLSAETKSAFTLAKYRPGTYCLETAGTAGLSL